MTIGIGGHSTGMPDAHPPVAPMSATRYAGGCRSASRLLAPVGIEPVKVKESPGARELVVTIDGDVLCSCAAVSRLSQGGSAL